MKRLLNLMLALLFSAALAGCGTSMGSPKNPSDEIALNSMYNKKTGQIVSLGMKRETVENLLGKGTEQKPVLFSENDVPLYSDHTVLQENQYISYRTGEDFIVVTYRNNSAVAISSYGNFCDVKPGPSNWNVKHGLSYGNSMSDIVAKYGEVEPIPLAPNKDSAKEGEGFLVTQNASWKKPILLSYCYDKDGKRLDSWTDENILSQLSFIVDEEQDGLMWYTVSYGIESGGT